MDMLAEDMHGFWSAFQSLGWDHEMIDSWRRPLAAAIAVALTVGNIAIAVSVMAGWVG